MRPARSRWAFALAVLLTLQGCFLFPSYIGRLDRYPPEVAAAQRGDIETVRAAIDRKPRLLKYREWGGATLLHGVVGHDQEAMAAFLLARGAGVNAKDKQRITPLHLAAMNGNLPIVRLLLRPRAKLNPVDSSGRTPLDRAVAWEQQPAADFLRSQGARTAAQVRPPD